MREIINISSGNCGNSLGLNFWESINDEHGVGADGKFEGTSDLQLERIYVYYHEGYNSNQFIPRHIAVDLDPGKIDHVRGSPLGKIFPVSHCISGHSGGSNNFAKGYFSDGVSLLPELLDTVRHELETSDCPQGIQICHALGGGTGAGLSTLILDAVRDEYPDLVVPTFSVIPSPKVSDIVIEPYNAVLAMSHLLSSADMIFCLDNEALLASCLFGLRLKTPTYGDLNHIIANSMSGITTCLRFPGQLNTGLRKLSTNCVPFPRYQWFIPAYVPLVPRPKYGQERGPVPHYSIPEMVRDMFDPQHSMCAVDMKKGKFLTASAIFRGRMSTREVENSIMQVQQKNSSSFVPWIPDNMKTSICDIAPRGASRSATFFANNSAISVLMYRVLRQYRSMFRRQAFLHWFYGEGMEEQDFLDAETNVYDIAEAYSRIQATSIPDDDSSDDEGPRPGRRDQKRPMENFVLRHSEDQIPPVADENNSSSYKGGSTKTQTATRTRPRMRGKPSDGRARGNPNPPSKMQGVGVAPKMARRRMPRSGGGVAITSGRVAASNRGDGGVDEPTISYPPPHPDRANAGDFDEAEEAVMVERGGGFYHGAEELVRHEANGRGRNIVDEDFIQMDTYRAVKGDFRRDRASFPPRSAAEKYSEEQSGNDWKGIGERKRVEEKRKRKDLSGGASSGKSREIERDYRADESGVDEPVPRKRGSAPRQKPSFERDNQADKSGVDEPVPRKRGNAPRQKPSFERDHQADESGVDEPVPQKRGGAPRQKPSYGQDHPETSKLERVKHDAKDEASEYSPTPRRMEFSPRPKPTGREARNYQTYNDDDYQAPDFERRKGYANALRLRQRKVPEREISTQRKPNRKEARDDDKVDHQMSDFERGGYADAIRRQDRKLPEESSPTADPVKKRMAEKKGKRERLLKTEPRAQTASATSGASAASAKEESYTKAQAKGLQRKIPVEKSQEEEASLQMRDKDSVLKAPETSWYEEAEKKSLAEGKEEAPALHTEKSSISNPKTGENPDSVKREPKPAVRQTESGKPDAFQRVSADVDSEALDSEIEPRKGEEGPKEDFEEDLDRPGLGEDKREMSEDEGADQQIERDADSSEEASTDDEMFGGDFPDKCPDSRCRMPDGQNSPPNDERNDSEQKVGRCTIGLTELLDYDPPESLVNLEIKDSPNLANSEGAEDAKDESGRDADQTDDRGIGGNAVESESKMGRTTDSGKDSDRNPDDDENDRDGRNFDPTEDFCRGSCCESADDRSPGQGSEEEQDSPNEERKENLCGGLCSRPGNEPGKDTGTGLGENTIFVDCELFATSDEEAEDRRWRRFNVNDNSEDPWDGYWDRDDDDDDDDDEEEEEEGEEKEHEVKDEDEEEEEEVVNLLDDEADWANSVVKQRRVLEEVDRGRVLEKHSEVKLEDPERDDDGRAQTVESKDGNPNDGSDVDTNDRSEGKDDETKEEDNGLENAGIFKGNWRSTKDDFATLASSGNSAIQKKEKNCSNNNDGSDQIGIDRDGNKLDEQKFERHPFSRKIFRGRRRAKFTTNLYQIGEEDEENENTQRE